MAYKIMLKLIPSGRKSKETLHNMCDVYYGAGRLTDDEYNKLTDMVTALEA